MKLKGVSFVAWFARACGGRPRFVLRCGVAVVVALAIPSHARAVEKVWSTATSNWWEVGPWLPAGVPAPSDSATFNQAGNYEVRFDGDTGDRTVSSFLLNNGNVTFRTSAGPTRTLNMTSAGFNTSLLVQGGTLTLGSLNQSNPIAFNMLGFSSVRDGGTLNVTNGSQIETTGIIFVGETSGGNGTLSIQGAGSSVTQTSSAIMTVGRTPLGTTATVNIGTSNGGATLTTGSGTLTILPTGTVTIGGASTFGALNANGNIVVNGGRLIRNAGGGINGFNLASGRTLTATNEGQVNFTGTYGIASDRSFVINSGADLTTTNFLDIGFGGALSVDGAGSTVTVGSSSGESFWNGTATFSNHALGSAPGGISSNSGTSATITVQSGADLTVGNLFISTGSTAGARTLTVTGSGSTVVLDPTRSFTIGHASEGAGTLNVTSGAAFTVGSGGSTTMNNTATININGGTVNLQTFTHNGGTLNFTAGSLSYGGNLTVGPGGLLGENLNLGSTRTLSLSGTTTVAPAHTLTLSNTTLSTGSLVVNGTFAFNSGTLNITGAGGLTIGNSGPFGGNFTFGGGRTLNVTNATTVNVGATLAVDGGAFTTGTLANSGSVIFDSGSIAANTLANQASGLLYVGPNRTIVFSAASTNAGEIQLGGASSAVAGAGTLTNTGLIHGDGRFTKTVTNSGAGEIRVDAGKRLRFAGPLGTNTGTISLQGGIAEFGAAFTNGSAGRILGRGTLRVGGAGLTNNGHVAFSSGITDVFGDVVNSTGDAARGIAVSGNADVTFWDDVNNVAGSLFRVSAGSSATFFGTFSGAGIDGPGDKYFEADVTPGASPGTAEFGGNVHFGGNSLLEIELGGTTAGTQYDQLQVAGLLSLDGALEVTLINGFTPASGNTFDLLDWGALSGTFSSISLPTLTGGKTWNTSQLYTTGILSVAASLHPGDFDGDGDVDGADFVAWQTNFPKAGGALLSEGDADGDGDVDGADFVVWQTNFPFTPGPAASPVPEPSAGILAAVALCSVMFRFRRK